ncbi:MAG: PASTA domain-containing protein, partial [Anaerovorax sp.]
VGRYASADEMLEALNNITFIANIVGDSVFAASKQVKAQVEKGEEPEEMRHQEETDRKGKKEKKGKNSGKKIRINKVKLAAVIVALICAIPASNLIVTAISNIGEGREVVVPNFEGLTYEQAQREAEDAKLEIEEGDTVFSSDYDEGQIVSQTPLADTKIKTGRTISVNISKG